MRKWWWLFLSLTLLARTASAESKLSDVEKVRQYYGLTPSYDLFAGMANVKIAVLDTGFEGFEAHKDTLPESALLVEKYERDFIERNHLGDPSQNIGFATGDHGRRMAQIAWGVTGNIAKGPKFYLLNANGITNFRRAVRYAIEQHVDIILYSQNWECCGNFDGKGFINAIVNDATQAGILWINAAGNYGGMVYNGPVPGPSDQGLRFRSRLDENPVQVILTWNSFTEDENAGTDKDLDLQIVDSDGKVVGESKLKQVLKRDRLSDGESYLAREKIRFEASNSRGKDYRIRILTKGGAWSATDRVRVTLIPERTPFADPDNQNKTLNPIEFLDASNTREIMVPADNPNVITVGDSTPESAKGPTADARVKPDVYLANSSAIFTDGLNSSGTSNAAAYFAGIVAVLKAQEPRMTRMGLLDYIKTLKTTTTAPATDPGQPTIPAERAVGLDFVNRYYEAIAKTVDQLNGGERIEAFRRQNGQLILQTPHFSKELAPLFPQFPWKESEDYRGWEFFLVTRHFKPQPNQDPAAATRVFGYARKQGSEGQYPWEMYHEDQRVFVELRLKSDDVTPLPPPKPLPGTVGGEGPKPWKTPTPQELLRYAK